MSFASWIDGPVLRNFRVFLKNLWDLKWLYFWTIKVPGPPISLRSASHAGEAIDSQDSAEANGRIPGLAAAGNGNENEGFQAED